MRTDEEVKKIILDVARSDDRIRAVLLNGSKANPNIPHDRFQDFDIVFIVRQLDTFTRDHSWINVFGELVIKQLPDQMSIGSPDTDSFAYLMLFEDGNRIDLTLYPLEKLEHRSCWPDSLTICLLDKDNLFDLLPAPNESDYFIKKPSPEEFKDTCNEFWWVCTYVVKGIQRDEVTYAKEVLETVVRPMFMKIVEWKIGTENNFGVSFGKGGRFMKKYLSPDYYTKVLQSYSDSDLERTWRALLEMMELFEQTSKEVASRLNFILDKSEPLKTIKYIQSQYLNRGPRMSS